MQSYYSHEKRLQGFYQVTVQTTKVGHMLLSSSSSGCYSVHNDIQPQASHQNKTKQSPTSEPKGKSRLVNVDNTSNSALYTLYMKFIYIFTPQKIDMLYSSS